MSLQPIVIEPIPGALGRHWVSITGHCQAQIVTGWQFTVANLPICMFLGSGKKPKQTCKELAKLCIDSKLE